MLLLALVTVLLGACGAPASSEESRIASFEAVPAEVAIGEPVAFRWEIATGTTDATCRLDADGDGSDDYELPGCGDDGSGLGSRLHVFDGPGAFTARLALDAGGRTDTATAPVQVRDPDQQNEPPVLGEISDQVVIRNLASPRTLAVDVPAQDPDGDALVLTYASSDASILPSGSTSCAPGACVLELEPSPERTAEVVLDLTVADGRGGSDATSFAVLVRPRLVTTTADAGDGSFRNAVEASAPGDVIGFEEDGAFADPQQIELADEVVLSVDLFVEGTGMERLTLSGGGAVRVLRVADATVVLRDLTIADGHAHDHATLPDGEGAAAVGGGIFSDGALTMRRVRITRNAAQLGGGVYNHEGVLTLEASTVGGPDAADGNTAAEGPVGIGGGIYNDAGTLRLDGTVVRNNAAVGDGGGIASRLGTVTVQGGEVSANAADTDGSGHGGGGGIASFGGVVTLVGVVVGGLPADGNRAAEGGALLNSGGSLTIAASTLEANHAGTQNLFMSGGAILNDGADATLVIRDGTMFEANEAGTGGAIANLGGSVTVSDSELVGNEALSGFLIGGGIYNGRHGSLSVSRSSLRGNAAGQSGGAIANRGVVTLDASTVGGAGAEDGNTAAAGGGIDSREADPEDTVQVTVQGGSRIEGNVAMQSGGGVFHGGGTLTILQSTIADNTAGASGGGLWSARDVLLDHAEVTGNRAEGAGAGQGGGGAYHLGPLTVLASHLRDNRATAAGGAVLTAGGVLVVQNETVLAGNAARDGGAVSLRPTSGDRPRATLEEAVLDANAATDSGGAIWNLGGAVEILDSTATANEARNGAVLYQEVPPEVDPADVTGRVFGTLLAGNSAVQRAGALYIHRSVLTVDGGSVLRGNTAGADGGAVYNGLGDVTIVGSVIGGPDAADANTGHFGGGVFNNRGTFACGANAEVTGNVARDEGGGIYDLFGDETSNLEGCTAGSGGNVVGNTPDDIAP